jgi:hypothetical protein
MLCCGTNKKKEKGDDFDEGARASQRKSLDTYMYHANDAGSHDAMMLSVLHEKSNNNVPKGRHLPHDAGYNKKKCHYALGHHESRAAA